MQRAFVPGPKMPAAGLQTALFDWRSSHILKDL
jgi:hypothetical protein